MRHLFAILLLVVHLFNITGYTFVFQYRMHKSDKTIIAQIDANKFNDNELVEVKVPLNMPYVINSGFERVDGHIEYKGTHYNYVKRKVSNDTLYLMCLPNKEKTQLAAEKSKFTKSVNDVPTNKKEGNSQVKKGGLTWEYNNIINLYQFKNSLSATRQENLFILSKPSLVFVPSPAQPPELA